MRSWTGDWGSCERTCQLRGQGVWSKFGKGVRVEYPSSCSDGCHLVATIPYRKQAPSCGLDAGLVVWEWQNQYQHLYKNIMCCVKIKTFNPVPPTFNPYFMCATFNPYFMCDKFNPKLTCMYMYLLIACSSGHCPYRMRPYPHIMHHMFKCFHSNVYIVISAH